MWPTLIVVDSPRFNLLSRIVQRDEHLRIQTLISKAPVETLNHRISHRFSRPNEVELASASLGPILQRPGLKSCAMINGDGARPLALS